MTLIQRRNNVVRPVGPYHLQRIHLIKRPAHPFVLVCLYHPRAASAHGLKVESSVDCISIGET